MTVKSYSTWWLWLEWFGDVIPWSKELTFDYKSNEAEVGMILVHTWGEYMCINFQINVDV